MHSRLLCTILLTILAFPTSSLPAGEAPAPLATENGDVNGDSRIDIVDVIYLIRYRFNRGPAPVDFACPVEPPPPPPPGSLATVSASMQLQKIFGRALVSARGNHFIIDSVPPIQGPNEEVNPLDAALGAFATCGIFLAEAVAREQEIPLEDATAWVEADFDVRGVAGVDVNPRLQIFRIHLDLPGANDEQVEAIKTDFARRCPVYTTLIESAPIEVTCGDETMSAPLPGLATARASARLSTQAGRGIVSARGNHFVVDSVPPVQGPNEERNPLDLLLGAFSTCGGFLYEKAAAERGFDLTDVQVSVEGDFIPAGLAGADFNPRLRAFRVRFKLSGVDAEQAAQLEEEFKTRCPMYTTLVRSAPIAIFNEIASE